MSSLPICRACISEVKPGEDFCWDCLGESIPTEELDTQIINGIIYHIVATQPTVYSGTITIPDTYVYTYHNNTSVSQTIIGIDFSGPVFFNPNSYRFSTIFAAPGDEVKFTVNVNVPTYTATIT